MHPTDRPPVTRLLKDWQEGDPVALEHLLPLVYEELRRLAGRQLGKERPGHTLSATALVHEAYLNLAHGEAPRLNDRAHFFAIASRVMRRVLVWHARRRGAAKRGGGEPMVTLNEELAHADADADAEEVLALDEALQELEALDARLCRVVECRYFTGLTVPETAEALGISPATVKRDWTTARAWLKRRLSPPS
jgi:RNA polymerase sigma factor (TIGR02999 family)